MFRYYLSIQKEKERQEPHTDEKKLRIIEQQYFIKQNIGIESQHEFFDVQYEEKLY